MATEITSWAGRGTSCASDSRIEGLPRIDVGLDCDEDTKYMMLCTYVKMMSTQSLNPPGSARLRSKRSYASTLPFSCLSEYSLYSLMICRCRHTKLFHSGSIRLISISRSRSPVKDRLAKSAPHVVPITTMFSSSMSEKSSHHPKLRWSCSFRAIGELSFIRGHHRVE